VSDASEEVAVAEQKSHYDFVKIIGETHKTTKSHREKRWNEYYDLSYQRIVAQMLAGTSGTVLDVGTSYGHWFPFLKTRGYSRILGVEIDANRAEQARRAGYDDVFNTDAATLPLPDNSCDAAVSNDVFVHILKLMDKVSVVREVERILRPGGIFVVNHTMSRAYGYDGYHVEGHCSFLDLDGWIKLIKRNTGFEIVDLKPSYYNWRNISPPLRVRLLRRLIDLPLVDRIVARWDRQNNWRYPIDEADTVYVRLRKPADPKLTMRDGAAQNG
jgi:SAM-dependent methyltransferase